MNVRRLIQEGAWWYWRWSTWMRAQLKHGSHRDPPPDRWSDRFTQFDVTSCDVSPQLHGVDVAWRCGAWSGAVLHNHKRDDEYSSQAARYETHETVWGLRRPEGILDNRIPFGAKDLGVWASYVSDGVDGWIWSNMGASHQFCYSFRSGLQRRACLSFAFDQRARSIVSNGVDPGRIVSIYCSRSLENYDLAPNDADMWDPIWSEGARNWNAWSRMRDLLTEAHTAGVLRLMMTR